MLPSYLGYKLQDEMKEALECCVMCNVKKRCGLQCSVQVAYDLGSSRMM